MFRMRLSSQKAPSTIRCIKTHYGRALHRKAWSVCQKAPSTIRCIKTQRVQPLVNFPRYSQKAPRTIRCIKTSPFLPPNMFPLLPVRKHRAP